MSIKKEEFGEQIQDGQLLPGFSGIGSFRGRRFADLSADEQTITSHFFTNPDSNVYAASDALPNELWALLMGQYARSNLTARERLIQLFNDIPTKNPSAKTLGEIASTIRSGRRVDEDLKQHMKMAGEFIETWGINYGHASLRDSEPIRICFEGVSQRATKLLESAREGAYQEQSTRALPFNLANMAIPFEVRGTRFEDRFKVVGANLVALYEEVRQRAAKHLDTKYAYLREDSDRKIQEETGDATKKLSDKAWSSVVEAKAFDIARSLIPNNFTTSLGITLNARRFQDQLTEWQSSELAEVRLLGKAAQIEVMKLSPSLMKYGNPSEFYADLPQRGRELSEEYAPVKNRDYQNQEVRSVLISATEGLEDLVLASILLKEDERGAPFSELVKSVRNLSPEERRRIAESQYKGKKPFEINPKTTEVGSFVFERTYDIGGYRDLQRQRGDRQQTSPYSTNIGFHMPEEIFELGEDLPQRYFSAMEDVRKLHDDLKSEGLHSAAQYAPAMANLITHVVTLDPNQLFYQAKLRGQAAGADSYRTIALQEMQQGLDKLPAFKGLIEYDSTPYYQLNRLPEAVNGIIKKAKEKK